MLNATNLKYLHITYANPDNLEDTITLDYKLRNTPIAIKWVNRVLIAHDRQCPIDEPNRFYGFNSKDQESKSAINNMNHLIEILKTSYNIQIDRYLTHINDQDTLNYLHHIFEVEHGLLDVQCVDLDLQKHLSELNILVHRCESIQRGNYPRHVVTYFGLQKTESLDNDDYQFFEQLVKFGTVYINYVEIGKTLQDLALDQDTYIDPQAFRPFKHYSADFTVRFFDYNLPPDHFKQYYLDHQEFFLLLGYSWRELSRSIGAIPVADLESDKDVLQLLKSRQFVKAVQFS